MSSIKRNWISIIFLIVILCPLLTLSGTAAEDPWMALSGKSKIIHYTKNDYKKEAQFWSMAEDDHGVIYFGTNYGVSIFDGRNWSHLSLTNNSSVHAVIQGEDGQIFVGGYNEFGTIEKDQYGAYYYQSMVSLLSSKESDFKEIWQILSINNQVIFRTFESLIIISKGKAIVFPSQKLFTHLAYLNQKLYVVDLAGINILDLDNLKYDPFISSRQYNSESIISILPSDIAPNMIAFTKKGNSYIINPKAASIQHDKNHLQPNASDQIFSAIKTKDGFYYLGTINSHLIIYDITNKSKLTTRTDLQDKTVLNIYESKNGDIWTLLNRGVDCIEKSFPGSMIFEGASVYDAKIYNQRIYVATNQGVYMAQVKNKNLFQSIKDFQLLEGLEAQAWSLFLFDNKLFVGHDKGIYVIEKDNIYPVEGSQGRWKVISVKGNKDILLACGYDGMDVLDKNREGKYVFKNRITNMDISARDIVQSEESGVFWICHGYLGVFKISIDQNYTRVISREHFTDKNGLPSQFNINVTVYNGDIIFLSRKGIFSYNKNTNHFEERVDLNEIFKESLNISKITEKGDRTWFVQNDALGYFDKDRPQKIQKNLFSSLNGTFLSSMEFIKPIGDDKIMVGTNEGLSLFRLSAKAEQPIAETVITTITYKNAEDSLIYVALSTSGRLQLPYDVSSLTFYFTAPKLSPKRGLQFSYKLEDFDKSWSDWDDESFREFSYLKSGSYTFKVKAKSLLDQTSEIEEFRVEILPIWYQTTLAYWIFSLLAVVLILLVMLFVRRKLISTREEEAKLRKVLELELQQVNLQREKELIIKDNEKLEEDIVNKSKEIANYTMLLVKKHDLLAEISEELNEIKKYAKLDKTKNSIRSIARKISLNLQDEEHLKVFDTNFERVHHEFFNELKIKFPDLQQKELRLCGLVKMNMTTKEIASILNISVRGIETARYRLKKKLSIDHGVNMAEFLDKLSTSKDEDFKESGVDNDDL